MKIFNLTPMKAAELSFQSQISNMPFVIRGVEKLSTNDAKGVEQYFNLYADTLRDLVRQNGVLLFRGLPLNTAAEYEAALEALGYELMDSNFGGASPRSKITQRTFVSTEAPPPFIIGIHTEFCYQTTRPGMVSFFSAQPSAAFGETPVFDCEKVWNALSDGLREKLKSKGLLYRRFYPQKKSVFNFRKTWWETFETKDKSIIEHYMQSEGMRYEWLSDGSLSTELNLPAVMYDSVHQKPRISITMFNADSLLYNLLHFKERYNPLLRKALEWFITWEYGRKNAFLQVMFGDGTPFTREESVEIQQAAWNNAIVFKWQQGDLMIMDNIAFAHARLNVKKPRQLVVAMADGYDLREYCASQSQ